MQEYINVFSYDFHVLTAIICSKNVNRIILLMLMHFACSEIGSEFVLVICIDFDTRFHGLVFR
jgi:hypothetical protein